jgi:hypothetical protein
MQTTTAEALVDAEPAVVYSAVLCLVADLWSVTSDDVIDAQPGERLAHAVRLDGETNCWLTWELSAVARRVTRVRLVHDEADLRTAPEADLDSVLDRLRVVLGTPTAASG